MARERRWWPAALAAGLVLSAAAPAWSFCRATTCTDSSCKTDAAACVIDGFPLFWSSSCITISIQGDGAPHAGISYDQTKSSVERAVEAWTSVECPGGGHPSIQVRVDGPVTCSTSEYNSDKHNANIVMFRDDAWPYATQSQDTLGFTRVRFDRDSGELYDADIELNAVAEALAVGRKPKPTEADLDSIITHELGHLLGLNHSLNVAATMVGGYQDGTYELRTLDQDDIQGICTIYPPSRSAPDSSCEPRHGFSALCAAEQPAQDMPATEPADGNVDDNSTSKGCSVSDGLPPTGFGSFVTLGVMLLLGVGRGLTSRARHEVVPCVGSAGRR